MHMIYLLDATIARLLVYLHILIFQKVSTLITLSFHDATMLSIYKGWCSEGPYGKERFEFEFELMGSSGLRYVYMILPANLGLGLGAMSTWLDRTPTV